MTDLALSFQITLIGMGLVFGAIIVLWGLMVLLTAVIRDRSARIRKSRPCGRGAGLHARAG